MGISLLLSLINVDSNVFPVLLLALKALNA